MLACSVSICEDPIEETLFPETSLVVQIFRPLIVFLAMACGTLSHYQEMIGEVLTIVLTEQSIEIAEDGSWFDDRLHSRC